MHSCRDKNHYNVLLYEAAFQNTFKIHHKHILNQAISKVIQQATKSPQITMDEKCANTFLFHNLPPELKKKSQRSFLFFSLFPYWIKEKSVATLDKPQHLQTQSQKPSSQFSHHITELVTLLRTNQKWGYIRVR